jgi:glycosyltransferase involved in cell wall biosynthesis
VSDPERALRRPAVWFPAIRAGTGADVFTQRLRDGLNANGYRAQITWLPHRAEYLPWSVQVPEPPSWANVVHVNTWLHRRFLPRHLPLIATMHLCVHDPLLRPYKNRMQDGYHRAWIRPLEAGLLARVQRIVAVSHYTAERTREAFSIEKVPVIHNGVPDPADGNGSHREARSAPFRLLYVGNWSRRKGVDMLRPLMERLGTGFELSYTADAHGADELVHLPSNCRRLGRLDQRQLQHAYREADALVFPSRMEGLPLTLIEAMANSLVPIAAASSSIPEVVTDGVDGLLFPPDDVEGCADAVRRLAGDDDMRESMGMAARATVREHFSMDSMVDAYVAAYRELL